MDSPILLLPAPKEMPKKPRVSAVWLTLLFFVVSTGALVAVMSQKQSLGDIRNRAAGLYPNQTICYDNCIADKNSAAYCLAICVNGKGTCNGSCTSGLCSAIGMTVGSGVCADTSQNCCQLAPTPTNLPTPSPSLCTGKSIICYENPSNRLQNAYDCRISSYVSYDACGTQLTAGGSCSGLTRLSNGESYNGGFVGCQGKQNCFCGTANDSTAVGGTYSAGTVVCYDDYANDSCGLDLTTIPSTTINPSTTVTPKPTTTVIVTPPPNTCVPMFYCRTDIKQCVQTADTYNTTSHVDCPYPPNTCEQNIAAWAMPNTGACYSTLAGCQASCFPPTPTFTPTPTPLPTTVSIVCSSYQATTGTTPVTISWTKGTGIQMWDSANQWWWNGAATSPLTVSSVNNAGAVAGIPSGRTVYVRSTYDYVTFSPTTSVVCQPPTGTPTKTPTPTPAPSSATGVCQSYQAATNTTPVTLTWTSGSRLQVWDSTNQWWWNGAATSPLTVSSVNNAGAVFGIPPGRVVYFRTTYDGVTFSPTNSVTCQGPTATPTLTSTPTNSPTSTPTNTPTPTPIIAQCDAIRLYKAGVVVTPTTVSPGDSIVIAVTGGNATKARVRINGKMVSGLVGWTETMTKNTLGEYVVDYTVPLTETFLTIESEIYGLDGVWH